jgi:ParB family chromosome partitioning protein
VSEKKRGLGRGLGALIPTAPGKEEGASSGPSPVDLLIPARAPAAAAGEGAPARNADTGNGTGDEQAGPATVADPDAAPTAGGAYFAELPRDAITPNPRQPREVFDEEAMAELVHSVREVGLLQPIVVRPQGDGRYELIMGERRWRAAAQAGLETIPAIVRQTGDDVMLRDALLENLHRAQLNPLEEAAAYDQLLADFGCTHDELAGRIGRSRPQISNTLRLLKLPPSVQRRVAAGVLPDRSGWPSASWPRDCRSAPSRRSWPWAGTRPRRPGPGGRTSRWPPSSRSWRTGWPTGSRPGSRWTWVAPRAGSWSSSPPSTTWSASSA